MIDIKELFDEVLGEYKQNPIDLLNINDEAGELNYLNNMGPTYMRTFRDILQIDFKKEKSEIKILEIGSYLGFVSIGLRKLGFNLTAADLPVFMQNKTLQEKYQHYNILYHDIDLKNKLPFESNYYDLVINCETLEHLNFNPVPVIAEFYRVIKPNGFLYIAVPNIASLENRLKLLKGESIYNSIDDFYAQLDSGSNFSVGLHWREYSISEITYLLKKEGFIIIRSYFFTLLDMSRITLKFYIRSLWVSKNLRYSIQKYFAFLKENITVICQKQKLPLE